jgi:hypothetical protein
MNCSQFGVVSHNTGRENRHLVVTTSSQTRYGQPYFISVNNNVVENSMGGDSYASYAFEQHGFGRWISWTDNVIDSCYSGFNIEGGDQIISGNIIAGCRTAGIVLGDLTAGRRLHNIIISDNHITQIGADSTGAFYGVWFWENADSSRQNISIHGNTFDFGDITARSLTRCVLISAGDGAAVNCSIDGNTFLNSSAYAVTDFCLRIEQAGWTADNNKITGYERAAYITGADCSFTNNKVGLTGAAASTVFAVEIRANNCVATNNIFRNIYRALFVVTGATGTAVLANVQIGSTVATVDDNGTGTLLAYAGSGF